MTVLAAPPLSQKWSGTLTTGMVVHPHLWYYRAGRSGEGRPAESQQLAERIGSDDIEKEELFSLYFNFLGIASVAEP